MRVRSKVLAAWTVKGLARTISDVVIERAIRIFLSKLMAIMTPEFAWY